jgi:hypothetical protein
MFQVALHLEAAAEAAQAMDHMMDMMVVTVLMALPALEEILAGAPALDGVVRMLVLVR